MKTLDEYLASLPPERRARVEERASELILAEKNRREVEAIPRRIRALEIQGAYQNLSPDAKKCFVSSIWQESSRDGMAHWHIPMYRSISPYEKFDCEIFRELVEFMKLSGLNKRIYEIEILETGLTADQILEVLSEPAFPNLEELYVMEGDVFLQLYQRREDLLKAMPAFRYLSARGEYTTEDEPTALEFWIERKRTHLQHACTNLSQDVQNLTDGDEEAGDEVFWTEPSRSKEKMTAGWEPVAVNVPIELPTYRELFDRKIEIDGAED